MKKIILIALLLIPLLLLAACTSNEPTRDDYIKIIVKELNATEYSYVFTPLEGKKQNKYICDFYTWQPHQSYSKWVCGSTEGYIDCEIIQLVRY